MSIHHLDLIKNFQGVFSNFVKSFQKHEFMDNESQD
jgi:hypothetical protein